MCLLGCSWQLRPVLIILYSSLFLVNRVVFKLSRAITASSNVLFCPPSSPKDKDTQFTIMYTDQGEKLQKTASSVWYFLMNELPALLFGTCR